jgi:hypothetical protein
MGETKNHDNTSAHEGSTPPPLPLQTGWVRIRDLFAAFLAVNSDTFVLSHRKYRTARFILSHYGLFRFCVGF